jgi:hypothetical protein
MWNYPERLRHFVSVEERQFQRFKYSINVITVNRVLLLLRMDVGDSAQSCSVYAAADEC